MDRIAASERSHVMEAVAFSFVSKACSLTYIRESSKNKHNICNYPFGQTPYKRCRNCQMHVLHYLRPSFVSSSEDNTPLQTFPKELLGFNLASSRSGVASLFFLLPKNFLKGWNLLAFFLSADNKTNTHQSLSTLHLRAHWWITAPSVKQSPRKNEAKEQSEA